MTVKTVDDIFPLPKGEEHTHTWVQAWMSTLSNGVLIPFEYCESEKCEARR